MNNVQHIPRFMIAAPSSGTGKTMITCGLLELLRQKGRNPVSFKCGPDYIDPMFHTMVMDIPCRNLDPWFTDREAVRALLARNASGKGIAVIEGVMGYYDGLGMDSERASSCDLAQRTETPVILVINARGMSRSLLPLISGFLDFQGSGPDRRMIRGVILNRVSGMLYPRLKQMIESALDISVIGYVPPVEGFSLESRHLGLIMPEEITGLRANIRRFAEILQKTIDMDALMHIARQAPDLQIREPDDWHLKKRKKLRIAVAEDEAFCFHYEDNLDLLREAGAELISFSPMRDTALPHGTDALILHGGYPELHAETLSRNESMRHSVRNAVQNGLPTIAECGGFLYLHRSVKDLDGRSWPMLGIFPFDAWYTGHLKRFGYITLKEGAFFGQNIGPVRSHEFHYYESEDPGHDFLAEKPAGSRSWRCIHSSKSLYAGFPHLYYPANPKIADAFLSAAEKRGDAK